MQLQSGFTYPIIDNNAANLDYFFPFEDVPSITIFDNIAGTDEGICSGTHCPTGGTRGIIQRAAYFDGVDDYLQLTGDTRETIAVWVKAERGTIIDATNINSERGVELDVDSLLAVTYSNGDHYQTLNFDLPQNEWVHLVAVTDYDNATATIYINGAVAASMSIAVSGNQSGGEVTIGANNHGTTS